MTKLFEDIRKQPEQIISSLRTTLGPRRTHLGEAAEVARRASHLLFVGIGASWHAAMAAHAILAQNGRLAPVFDASELLHFVELPPGCVVVLLSRSGESIEIVRLIDKCHSRGAQIIAITNTPKSTLAKQAHIVLPTMAEFDHQVSISMYSVLAMIAGLLSCEIAAALHEELSTKLQKCMVAAAKKIPEWASELELSSWLVPDAPTYFLARGVSLASAHEARLLWEEAAKAPASVLPTGSFRHGPQEILKPGVRIALWIDGEKMREEDLLLARDLCRHGVRLAVIGQRLPSGVGDHVFNLPEVESNWQFLTDIIPMQIAAERLAQRRGEDCDAFRLCSYIVEAEGGLATSS